MAKTSVNIVNFWKSQREGKIKAIFDIEVGDIVLRDFRLVDGSKGYFIGPPSREYAAKDGTRKWKTLVELPEPLLDMVLSKAQEAYGAQPKEEEEVQGWR